ncbi:MAG: DUF4383 domain-containing protein [Actinobacteria bacterium]|nr:DUF4383 domain-containing protein [Actinomycetota bacterium]
MAGNRTPGQMFALVFGVVYVLVGVVGLFVDTVVIFDVNLLHSIVHIITGAAWVFASRDPAMAKTVNTAIGVVYLLLALLGVFGLLDDLINHNPADAVLHLVSGAASLYFGTAGAGARSATA